MPTPTYRPLATVTLGSSASSVTFSSIPDTYKDLILVMSGALSNTDNIIWRANNDTGSNYARVQFVAISSGPTTNGSESTTSGFAGSSYTQQSINITQWIDYSATDKHKVSVGRANSITAETGMTASRWKNTTPINSLTILAAFASGCTFSLYGISA
jgi:hypothetical protein